MSIIVNYNPDSRMAVINQVCPRTKQMLCVLEVHVGESVRTVAHKLSGNCGCCDSIAGSASRSYDLWAFIIWCAVRSALDEELKVSAFGESWRAWLLRQSNLISVTFELEELLNFSEMVSVFFGDTHSRSGEVEASSLTVIPSPQQNTPRVVALG